MGLYVGTSGWAYREWRPAFYPDGLPQARFLEHYATVLGACEINATFYRLQSADTMARWAGATPGAFRFAIKAHRRLTHGKTIAPDADGRTFLDAFLRSLGPLGDRLGVVLLQFPPYRRRDDGALAALVDAIEGRARLAFEFRHESWAHTDVAAIAADAGATLCVSETAGEVPAALPPGPHAYVRMRSDRYSPQARERWRALLAAEARERDVFAFAKHEGIPAGDPYGGIGLAAWLSGPAGN